MDKPMLQIKAHSNPPKMDKTHSAPNLTGIGADAFGFVWLLGQDHKLLRDNFSRFWVRGHKAICACDEMVN